jgi:mannan endo-1,4-beta-mannosidase
MYGQIACMYCPSGWRPHARTILLTMLLTVASSIGAGALDFVRTSDTIFTLGGKPFYVTGVNNHYLTYGSDAEVVRVLDDAVALGATTVRTFLQPIIGSLDDKVPTIWDWNKPCLSG